MELGELLLYGGTQLLPQLAVSFRILRRQGVAGINPSGQIAAVPKRRVLRADTGQIADEIGLVFPHKPF